MAAGNPVKIPDEVSINFWDVVSAKNLYEYLSFLVYKRKNSIEDTELYFTVNHNKTGLYFNIFDIRDRQIAHISFHYNPQNHNTFHYKSDIRRESVILYPTIKYNRDGFPESVMFNEYDRGLDRETFYIIKYFEDLLTAIVKSKNVFTDKNTGLPGRRGSPPQSPRYYLKYLKYKIKYLNLKKKLENLKH